MAASSLFTHCSSFSAFSFVDAPVNSPFWTLFSLKRASGLTAVASFSQSGPRFWRLAFHPFLCAVRTERTKTRSRGYQNMAVATDDGELDQRVARISSAIRVIPNFPKTGIMFQDITTLLLDTKAFKDAIDLFVERYSGKDISVVAGIEARGFIFGPPIALAIGAKFVPMRKPNKLPGEVISEEYSLEYGKDKIEMHVGAVRHGERALVVDDLIATGGTLCAAIKLLEHAGAEVVECACVIELPGLQGRKQLADKPLFVLVSSS